MDVMGCSSISTGWISELKWCDYKNGHTDIIDMLLKINMPGLSLTVTWGNDKKLLAGLRAWQESWTLREDYSVWRFCVTSQCTVGIYKKGGCGGMQKRSNCRFKLIKITNTWHASQPTDPWGKLKWREFSALDLPGLHRGVKLGVSNFNIKYWMRKKTHHK